MSTDNPHFEPGPEQRSRAKTSITLEWQELPVKLAGLMAGVDYTFRVRREVIPLLLVPGLGGSRLQTRAGRRVWDPDDSWFMLRTYGLLWSTPAAQKSLLVGRRQRPGRLQVANPERFDPAQLREPQRSLRGTAWRGGIAASVFGDLPRRLVRHPWPHGLRLCFDLRVHGFGYDWTADIRSSGEQLARHIRAITGAYRDQGRRCRQVILVTLGGGAWVARWACGQQGCGERVLGMIHHRRPVHGTPRLYRLIKAGAPRGSGGPLELLASTGRHAAATLGNMRGALQLLPDGEYRNSDGSRGWLQLADDSGAYQLRKPAAGPRGADPYSEIYLQQHGYWRLLWPELLEPAPPGGGRTTSQAADDFARDIEAARQLHERLTERRLPPSYDLQEQHRSAAGEQPVRYRIAAQARKKAHGKISRVELDPASKEGQELLQAAHQVGAAPGARARPRQVFPSHLQGGFFADVQATADTFLQATLLPGEPRQEWDQPAFTGQHNGALQLQVSDHIHELCQQKIHREVRR